MKRIDGASGVSRMTPNGTGTEKRLGANAVSALKFGVAIRDVRVRRIVLTIIAWVLCASPAAARAVCDATLRTFRAAGDGIRDDTQSIVAALGSGCALNGEGLRYKITRSLALPSNTNLRDLVLVQAIPAGELVRPLFGRSIENVTLTSVRIDRGADAYFGTVEDAGGIWLDDVKNLVMTDVEVTGNGPGTGILVSRSVNVVMTRPYVHDMRWAVRDGQPCNEVMEGIRIADSRNVTIESARVENLLPESVVVSQAGVDGCARLNPPQVRRVGQINNMTDGINPTGNQDVRIVNAEIRKTGEGFDISGSSAAHDLLIAGAYVHDVASACYKLSGSQGPNIVIRESRAVRCGLWGYVAVGSMTGISFINNTAVDIGSSGEWKAGKYGFFLAAGRADQPPPKSISFVNNRAEDGQRRTTMDYGFYLRPGSVDINQSMTFENNSSSGHREGAVMCDLSNKDPNQMRLPPWCVPARR